MNNPVTCYSNLDLVEMNKPASGSCDYDIIYNRLTGSSGNKQAA